MIVFLTEEESMQVTIKTLLGRERPSTVEYLDWIALAFNGKSDLQKNIPLKMRAWRHGNPHFVILQDKDSSDCYELKQQLQDLAAPTDRPHTVRIVCSELESWFLGELQAVEAVYPQSNATRLQDRAKFKDPDQLSNACQELDRLTGVSGKVTRARLISEQFSPVECKSGSFNVFWQTVDQLIPGEPKN
jgi:hypothetical protein